jgi:hypothetical protein
MRASSGLARQLLNWKSSTASAQARSDMRAGAIGLSRTALPPKPPIAPPAGAGRGVTLCLGSCASPLRRRRETNRQQLRIGLEKVGDGFEESGGLAALRIELSCWRRS